MLLATPLLGDSALSLYLYQLPKYKNFVCRLHIIFESQKIQSMMPLIIINASSTMRGNIFSKLKVSVMYGTVLVERRLFPDIYS